MGRPIAILLVLLAIIAAVIFWIYRGPTPPVDQIAAAKQRATDTIARTEAHRYAPDAVGNIQRMLADIDSRVDGEQRKLPFQRNYDAVHDQLRSVNLAIDNLESLARANKEAMAEALRLAVDNLQATVAAIETELADMPTAKGSRPALAAMRSDLAEVRTAADEVLQLQAQNQFHQAQQAAAIVQERADKLLQEILDTKERVRALRQRTSP